MQINDYEKSLQFFEAEVKFYIVKGNLKKYLYMDMFFGFDWQKMAKFEQVFPAVLWKNSSNHWCFFIVFKQR